MSSIEGDVKVFDLSPLSVHDYRVGPRTFRVILAIGLTLLIIVAAVVMSTTAGFFSDLYKITMASTILAGFGSLSILAIFMFSPGAVRAEVSASGVRLGYGSGRTKELRWDRPGSTVTLWLSPESLPDGRPYPFARHEIRTLHPLDNALTPDAFDAILGAAREAGLEVQTAPQGGRPARTVYRIRSRKPART
jgi:hypothetical protein